jgi:DNA-binding NtrC family response regulator
VTAPDVLPKIIAHDWPGNVRELRNVLVRALVFNSGTEIKASDIEIDRQWRREQFETETVAMTSDQVPKGDHPFLLPSHGVHLDHLEKDLIQQALDRSRNNQSKAAKLLGITRHTLRYRLEKHGLMDRAAGLES